MKETKITWWQAALLLVVLVIVVVGGVLLFKRVSHTPSSNEAEVYTTKTSHQQTATSTMASDSVEEILEGKDEEVILQTVDDFMVVFDNASTENYKEEMSKVFPIMTKKAQENLSPYYESKKNTEKVYSELQERRHYIHYVPGEEQARVLTLTSKIQQFNDEDQSYEMRYIMEHILKKEEGVWKIDLRIVQSFPDSYNAQLFTE